MVKTGFPTIHFYDQDFVDLYDRTWAWLEDFWGRELKKNGLDTRFFRYPQSDTINQFDACLSTFFLVYSNKVYPATPSLGNFYNKQEESGAIRGEYDITTGKPVFTENNPEGVGPPALRLCRIQPLPQGGQQETAEGDHAGSGALLRVA